ncbi:unnamed protein product [Lactuca virosa]|uniref:Transposase (putative) gypsy type domain-containing protein n=1 Tax=Lactuca virosa TaxID=75947 RepID=A0AAU9M7K8_9ASTR|nr:unnamed protein product [Lactuca virosa]
MILIPSSILVCWRPTMPLPIPLKALWGFTKCSSKFGLRLPAFDFLETVLDYYGLHIAQIAPNDFCKILCFTLLCVALDVSPTINLCCHFYITMSNGDWVSFSLCHGLVELCDGLPSSIKYWKEEFFFVHASAFSGPMVYDATADRAADRPGAIARQATIKGETIGQFCSMSGPRRSDAGYVWHESPLEPFV